MKIELWCVNKTGVEFVEEGIKHYTKRILRYLDFGIEIILPPKNSTKLPVSILKKEEGKLILSKTKPNDFVILLDEKGKQHSSQSFASFVEVLKMRSSKRIVFIIGGAYGFSDEVYNRSNAKISLSTMTLPHELVRVVFVEQLYRACSILNNENYHHE